MRKVPVALVVGVGLAMAGLTACGRTGSATVAPATVMNAQSNLRNLARAISGSPAQRRAGSIIYYHKVQDPLIKCMSTSGFKYVAAPFVDVYAGTTLADIPDGWGQWTADLRDDRLASGIAEAARRLAPLSDDIPNAYYAGLSDEQRAAYNNALNTCNRAAPDATNADIPRSALKLEFTLIDLIAASEKDPRVRSAGAGYPGCMTNAGVPAQSFQDLITQVQRAFDRVRPPEAGQSPSAGWTSAVGLERTAASADARCRAYVHDLALTLLDAPLEEFVARHQVDLVTVGNDWDALVASASTYPEW